MKPVGKNHFGKRKIILLRLPDGQNTRSLLGGLKARCITSIYEVGNAAVDRAKPRPYGTLPNLPATWNAPTSSVGESLGCSTGCDRFLVALLL
ncbi:MAG: hypothetical protein DCF22_16745 [Leptolyngbya sp.]|nr:MAG: hypothetical protein DCF22_16745 [Leptolyngbya sp.]